MLSDSTADNEIAAFRAIERFILSNGDRQTYCNMYNNNPHYALGDSLHVYLNPSVGVEQHNINCDPTKSDFNQIVVQDQRSLSARHSPTIYYRITLDTNENKLDFQPTRTEAMVFFEQLKNLAQK